MTTTTVHTIGVAGDYTTLQAWEDAAPANLVTSDVVWRGELLESFSYATSGSLLSIGGSTQDATRYKVLAPQSGLGFKDNANKLTNALRANSSNGVMISGSANTYSNRVITSSEPYARLEGLQIVSTSTGSGGVVQGVMMTDCIVEGAGISANATLFHTPQPCTNTLFVLRTSTATTIGCILSAGAGAVADYVNCTFVVPSDFTAATYMVSQAYGTAMTFKNCAFFGATNVSLGTTSCTWTNCYTDAASPPTGCTTVAYDTSTGSGFENITDATRDFRIKTGSALKDNGTATGAPAADIVGTTRATVDVGVWEFTGGGGGGSPLPPISQFILSNAAGRASIY